jgi:hypothetical protein
MAVATLRRPPGLVRLAARAPLLALALTAGACSSGSSVLPSFVLDDLFPAFMGPTRIASTDSLTVQRVRGADPTVEPLLPESGNVWPEAEAPRPTQLGSADEAMRNIPAYSPALIQGAPPARSPVPTPGVNDGRSPVGDVRPPGVRSVSPAPAVRPAGSSRANSMAPTGGGAVIRDGNVETWIGPDGRATTRIVTD